MDNNKHFTAYIKSNCPYCRQAKDEFFRQKVNHTIHIMDDDLEGLEKMREFFNYRTVPMIFVQDAGFERLIGGYTDLVKYFNNIKD